MPTFYAKDYGATANDSTDDSAAINAAVRAANQAYRANPSGGQVTVELGVGTYILSGDPADPSAGAVELLSGVALSGAGMGQTTLKLADNFNARINGIVRTALETVKDVKISGLTIDGNRANNTGHQAGFICGMKEDGSGRTQSNITLSHVEIMNCTAYGFNPHEITTNMVIENSRAHNNGLDGFVADLVVGGTYRNNVSYDNDRHGFNIQNATKNLLLENNEAYSNGSAGVVVQRGNIPPAGETTIPWVTDIRISGGQYRDNGREGILVKLSDNVTVERAAIYGNQRQGVRIEGATDTFVQNSQVYNNSQEADNTYDEVQLRLRLDDVTGQTFYSLRTQILNNTIYSNGTVNARYGIREEPTNDDGGPTGTVVSGNTISGMDSGTVSVPAGATDNPVVATDDAYNATEDATLAIGAAQGVLANDTAPDGGKAAIAAQITTAQGGTVSLKADGSFTYTPKANFFGSDSFVYTAVDGDGDRDTGTVTLTVQDVPETNPPPPTTPFPAIAVGTTQMETLALSRFTLVSLGAAQGGQAVENRNKDLEATAKGTFTGESGTYKVKVAYYDESDGASPMGIRVNGATAASWIADKQLGSTGSDSKTLTFYEAQLNLTQGSTLEIYGTRKDAELVRIDYIAVSDWQMIA